MEKVVLQLGLFCRLLWKAVFYAAFYFCREWLFIKHYLTSSG